MNLNQIIITLQFKNLTSTSQIYSLELNLLDTDSISLIRNGLNLSGDTIKLPFSLSSNDKKELEFYFNANECTLTQKLRGTLTYMLKVAYIIIFYLKCFHLRIIHKLI